MRVEDLGRLYDYGYWANRRLFSALQTLTPEQFTQVVAGSFGSIRSTLVHILSAEWGWLERCGGARRGDRLDPERYPTLELVVAEWGRVEGYTREFLSGLDDADLAREIEFSLATGPKHVVAVGDLLQQAALHAVHHRGQVAMLTRMLGVTPGNFDFVIYAAEQSASAEAAVSRDRVSN